MEVERLPADCQEALKEIEQKLEAARFLEKFLPIAPDIIYPRPFGIRKYKDLLSAIEKGVKDYGKFHEGVRKLLDPILRNRINQIIDLQIYKHTNDNNREALAYWTSFQAAFGG